MMARNRYGNRRQCNACRNLPDLPTTYLYTLFSTTFPSEPSPASPTSPSSHLTTCVHQLIHSSGLCSLSQPDVMLLVATTDY